MALTNGGPHLQTVLNTALQGFIATLDVTDPSVFKGHMFFYSYAMVQNAIQANTLKCSHLYFTGILLDYTVQKTRSRERLIQKLPTLPACEAGFFLLLVRFGK